MTCEFNNSPTYSTLDDLWRPPGESVATRNISRKSSASSRGFLVGGAELRMILFESGLERACGATLLAHSDVVDLREQPQRVSYIDADGCIVDHTFDFFALMHDGTRIAIAVKPCDKAEKEQLLEKIKLIAAQAGPFADAYMLVTEKQLARNLIANADLIRSCRRGARPDHDARLREIVAKLHGRVTIETLVDMSQLDGDGFRAAVRLIDEGDLTVVSGGRIDYATVVKRSVALSTERATCN